MADAVFQDRVGLIAIDGARLVSRLPAVRGFGGGLIRDVFLPRTAEPQHVAAVKAAGLFAHLWAAVDALSVHDYATRTLLDIQRLKPGACELNIELAADPPLPGFIRETVRLIRLARPNYRLRVNVAPWKAYALPADLLAADRHLYAAMQCYEGNMGKRVSEADVLTNMIGGQGVGYGLPLARVSICYAAAINEPPWFHGGIRVPALPDLARVHRGSIFSDDLMADVGLL